MYICTATASNCLCLLFIHIVLKSLGSTSGGDFGSLGVSWQGQPLSSESNEGLEFMSLPWDNSNTESSTALASILNRKGKTAWII